MVGAAGGQWAVAKAKAVGGQAARSHCGRAGRAVAGGGENVATCISVAGSASRASRARRATLLSRAVPERECDVRTGRSPASPLGVLGPPNVSVAAGVSLWAGLDVELDAMVTSGAGPSLLRRRSEACARPNREKQQRRHTHAGVVVPGSCRVMLWRCVGPWWERTQIEVEMSRRVSPRVCAPFPSSCPSLAVPQRPSPYLGVPENDCRAGIAMPRAPLRTFRGGNVSLESMQRRWHAGASMLKGRLFQTNYKPNLVVSLFCWPCSRCLFAEEETPTKFNRTHSRVIRA